MRRPTPRPRALGATHMRLTSAGSRPWGLCAPQPMGSARWRGASNRPGGPGGIAAQAADDKQHGGLGELVDVGRDAAARIEAGVEAGVELGEVRLDAEAGRRAGGVLDVDIDEAGREQTLD